MGEHCLTTALDLAQPCTSSFAFGAGDLLLQSECVRPPIIFTILCSPNSPAADGSSLQIGGVIGDSIAKFKLEILRLRGIPINQQMLLYQGRVLEDQQIYSAAVSLNNEILDLVIQDEAEIDTVPEPAKQPEDDDEVWTDEEDSELALVAPHIRTTHPPGREHDARDDDDGDDAANKFLSDLMAEWTTVFEK
jgi:hypothetical protein